MISPFQAKLLQSVRSFSSSSNCRVAHASKRGFSLIMTIAFLQRLDRESSPNVEELQEQGLHAAAIQDISHRNLNQRGRNSSEFDSERHSQQIAELFKEKGIRTAVVERRKSNLSARRAQRKNDDVVFVLQGEVST